MILGGWRKRGHLTYEGVGRVGHLNSREWLTGISRMIHCYRYSYGYSFRGVTHHHHHPSYRVVASIVVTSFYFCFLYLFKKINRFFNRKDGCTFKSLLLIIWTKKLAKVLDGIFIYLFWGEPCGTGPRISLCVSSMICHSIIKEHYKDNILFRYKI